MVLSLLTWASLFDRICILCYNQSCAAQKARFPLSMHEKVVVVDGVVIDRELSQAKKSHHYKIAMTFAWLARTVLERNTQILVLEADFLEQSPKPQDLANGNSAWAGGFGYGPRFWYKSELPSRTIGEAPADLEQAHAFLDREQWSVLRLGFDIYTTYSYKPFMATPNWLGDNGRCLPQCRCVPSTAAPWICSIRRLNHAFCPIGSTVAIALHQRARQALVSFGYAIQDRLLRDPTAEPITNVDNWISATLSPVHYVAPARVVQNHVHKQTHHSGTKSAVVLLNHTPEVSIANMLSFAGHCCSVPV